MGNCCGTPAQNETTHQGQPKTISNKKKDEELRLNVSGAATREVIVLKDYPAGLEGKGQSIHARYSLGRELGRGEFGITYLGVDKKTQELVACKSIAKHKLRTAVDVEDVRREVAIMHHLPPHPNIVGLKCVYEDDDAVHLVMELCEGGELFDRIVARGHYSERAAAAVIQTIVEVVQTCHEQGVIHRDLKPENYLFSNMKENSSLKAIDFGLSIFFKPGERFSEIVGSPYYMAPEILKRNYGPEIDVWSAGVILYILLCGVPPFWAETEQGVAQAILRGSLDFMRDPWPKVSENAKLLVLQMLDPDPKTRLTAQQVLDDPWLQNLKNASNVPLDAVRMKLKLSSAVNKLKRKALRKIAELLSVEENEGMKDMFDTVDTDNSGFITFDKLTAGLPKIGFPIADSEVKLLMEEAADANGDSTLDYVAFVTLVINLQTRINNDERLRKVFDHFDKGGRGYLDIDDLKQALEDGAVGDNDDDDDDDDDDSEVAADESAMTQVLLEAVDVDKDGLISYEEFVSMMMRSGTDWRKASRRYSRTRFKSMSMGRLHRDGSAQLARGLEVIQDQDQDHRSSEHNSSFD